MLKVDKNKIEKRVLKVKVRRDLSLADEQVHLGALFKERGPRPSLEGEREGELVSRDAGGKHKSKNEDGLVGVAAVGGLDKGVPEEGVGRDRKGGDG